MVNVDNIEQESLNIGALFMVTGISTFFVLAVILGLTGLHDAVERDLKAGFNAKIPADVLEHEAGQQELLESYAQDEDGSVRIPVDRAMEMVLEERQDG